MKDVVELVEVQELPAPVSGNAIYDTEHPYRHAEHVRQVGRVLAECSQTECVQLDISVEESVVDGRWQRQMRVIQGLFRLLDATPKNEQGAVIARVLAGIHGDNELARLQAALDSIERARQAVPKPPKAPDPPELAANCIHNHVVGRAIAAGGKKARKTVGGWYDNTVDGRPVYRYEHNGSVVTVYLEPQDYKAMELWAKVHALDALTLDVYLAVLALICDPRNKAAYPHFGWFVVNPAQVADMKAFRRYGNDRRVLIRKIVDALHTLSDLRTTFAIPWPGRGKQEKTRVARETGCRLFHIGSVVYIEQGELFEHPNEFPKDKQAEAVNIFVGKWANYWLRDGERYYWVAAASRRLLEMEHRPDRMGDVVAKKIGMLLLTVEGGTDSHNKTREFTVARLLETIGELMAEEYRGKRDGSGESREGEHWASRTEEYLQYSLTRLKQDGLLASYNFSSDYPEPGDRGRGWVERWLSAKVYLTTPEAMAKLEQAPQQAAQRAIKPRRVRGLGKPKKPLVRGQYMDAATVAAVYEAYKSRNWTQATLAKELKIARPTLSNVLNGKEAPSVELATRIRAFLDTRP